MRSQRIQRFGVAMGVAALLTVTGCGGDTTGVPAPAEQPALEKTSTTQKQTGFDECELIETDELAKALGVDAMYVTGRSVMTQTDGSRRASCAYFPEDVPGMLGMELNTVADTDPERFFEPFSENFENVEEIRDLGDRGEAVAYQAQGTSTHYIEVRTIVGDRGLHLFYSYQDEGGVMPKADGVSAGVILGTALERLPDQVTIPDGTPEGPCADIDLAPAAEALGAELAMARSVLSKKDSMSCYFSGGGASLEVILLTDPSRAEKATVKPADITHADLGDGAKVMITDAEALDARVNLGNRVVAITATYDTGPGTTPRPADVEMVRTVVDAVSEGN